jgi:hypothetical protein
MFESNYQNSNMRKCWSYDSEYRPIYEGSYDGNFVFYDEEDDIEEDICYIDENRMMLLFSASQRHS